MCSLGYRMVSGASGIGFQRASAGIVSLSMAFRGHCLILNYLNASLSMLGSHRKSRILPDLVLTILGTARLPTLAIMSVTVMTHVRLAMQTFYGPCMA